MVAELLVAFVNSHKDTNTLLHYRAMHFSAKCGIAIVYCPSVCNV